VIFQFNTGDKILTIIYTIDESGYYFVETEDDLNDEYSPSLSITVSYNFEMQGGGNYLILLAAKPHLI
jgi:hypothetical protein